MTKIAQFFCDYCNPSRQVREEGDEKAHGYAAEAGDDFPLGWWPVPGKGPKGTEGHACPECVLNGGPDVQKDIQERRSALARRMAGEEDVLPPELDTTGGWPSRTSPFSQEAPAGGEPDGG